MALYDPIYGASGQPTFQYPTVPVMPVTPALQTPAPAVTQAPSVKIITVSGEAAAKSMRLAPGSTLLASDENDAVIWFIKANEVGPNTAIAIPFDPALFNGGTAPSRVDRTAIDDRFDRFDKLAEKMNERLSSIEERMTRYESDDRHDKQRANGGNASGRH